MEWDEAVFHDLRLLGPEAAAKYAALGDSDRGHIRERYLSMVEHVDPAIRAKYLKVYAYY